MVTTNDDGSTSETTIQDSWRCLSDASDLRQENEWTGHTEFHVSSRFGKQQQDGSQQPGSMFSLAVIPKKLQTGKEAVDIFDEVKIRNDVCKTNKHLRLGFGDRRNRPRDEKLELLLCDEDQHDDRIGNIYMTLIGADERRPRLVLVCSEEINWFTKLEKVVGQYMTIITITADDDLLSLYGINKVRACLRDENDVVFFAGPCTGGSSWARLNKTRSIETAMLIRRRQIMFWKLFDVFAHLMRTRESIKFKSLLELPRHCDYWKEPRMIRLVEVPDSFINDFDGCCYGLREQFSHPPRYIKKPWRIVSWGVDFGDSLSRKCDGRHEHAPCAGRETIGTQIYTSNIVSIILKKLNESIDNKRIVLSNDESRRSPLKVRTGGNKSKAACVVVLRVHRKVDSPSELFPNLRSTFSASNLCGRRLIGERELAAEAIEGAEDLRDKMAANANTPPPAQPVIAGSGGGSEDLFLANQGSIARRSLAVINTVFQMSQLGNATTLPKFKIGIGMDISHAMIWCQDAFRLPTLVAISGWFMTGPIDDERSRIWLYNLYRYASQQDCERTLKQYVDKIRLLIKAFQQRIGHDEGKGVLECFADSEFIHRVDIFWDNFEKYVDSSSLPNVGMKSTLEDACRRLRNGTLVSTGFMLEHNEHELYSVKYRDPDWHAIMKEYWNFSTDLLVPDSSQIVFTRNKLVQCARELTLAIRLKNETVKMIQGGPDMMINERKLAEKITNRCFEGAKIAEENDIPMWAAVHLLMYYCSLSSLIARMLHCREQQRSSGRVYMAEDDANVLKKALVDCGKALPELEGIKELGWNVFFAEMIDESGAHANSRNERLKCLKEWVTWSNNPYDEQWESSKTPENRRGRHYVFGDEPEDEFKTPERSRWPRWAVSTGLIDVYLSRHVKKVEAKSMPKRVEPVFAAGSQGKPHVHEFLRASGNASSEQKPGWGFFYDQQNDPWSVVTERDHPTPEATSAQGSTTVESPTTVTNPFCVPPMAFDPGSESAGEDTVLPNDEWRYPTLHDKIRYERFKRSNKNLADRIGTIKLLAQSGFLFKPMVEEAIIPVSHKSTFSCYLRKVTSYIISWSGCVSMKTLRGYKRRDDEDWIRLYNYCIARSHLRQTHLYLETKEMAALCGVLGDTEVVNSLIRPITNKQFLNHAATSTVGSVEMSSGIRQAVTAVFSDFDIIKRSGSKKANKTNMQTQMDYAFGWGNLYHESVMEKEGVNMHKCFDVIAKAHEYVERLANEDDGVRAGASVHMWFSFGEFVQWNRDCTQTRFVFDVDEIVPEFCRMMKNLLGVAGAPVFVNLCTSSNFFHGTEMHLEQVIGSSLASALVKTGVAVTCNPLMWSELSNFIDHRMYAIKPEAVEQVPMCDENWEINAAFACIDKFLFREKMLFACTIGDETINQLEEQVNDIQLNEELARQPPEVGFVKPAEPHERMPTDVLRTRKTVNPMAFVDFDAVTPKPLRKIDLYWYNVGCREVPNDDQYLQPSSKYLIMCAVCSEAKVTGKEYDAIVEHVAYCPNCTSNWCRKYNFMSYNPEEADIMLRWAASIIVHEKNLSVFWGSLDPGEDMLLWMRETIRVFRNHHSGIGKYVSHLGTTRMPAKAASNAMYYGQGKTLNVDRQKVPGPNGSIVDLFQFTYDHWNRVYADYMRKLFPADVIRELFGGSEDPKEEAIGDGVEICLGILRIALMYEGCNQNYFGWTEVNDVLTGLEQSLITFNASAYPTGIRNRKITSGNKKKREVFTREDCLEVPTEVIPFTRQPVVPIMDESNVQPLPGETTMQPQSGSADADMPDAAQAAEPTEGKGFGDAYPSTEVGDGGAVAAPGSGEGKRRKITPQAHIQNLFGRALRSVSSIIDAQEVCVNCFSNEHTIEDCPKDGASDWKAALLSIQTGFASRQAEVEVEVIPDDDETPDVEHDVEHDAVMEDTQADDQDSVDETTASKRDNILLRHEAKSLEEIIGASVVTNVLVGDKNPRNFGFKDIHHMFGELHDHIQKTKYVPQRDHVSMVDQTNMSKYEDWTKEMSYGKAVPIGSRMAPFADKKWDVCGQFSTEMFKDRNLRDIMSNRTRRWSNVLRHKIGQDGPAVKCDEAGWVSVENFIRNDHCWDTGMQERAYDHASQAYREDILQKRREELMHGFWWSMNFKPIKRRFIMVAQVATPEDMGEIHKYEDPALHDENMGDRLATAKGWLRPMAIRATSGHSFTGDHRNPLLVNIDHERVNIRLTHEFASKMAGGYHVTEVRNLMSIVNTGIIPGGGHGSRDHAFFGEFAPWDPRNSSTLNYLGSENEYLLVLYVPANRLLKYRSSITYNGDIVVMDTVPFPEVQEIWISKKSPGKRYPAQDPVRITSHKVVDEVVIQCEYASKAAPPPVIRTLMDRFVDKANEIGRNDIVDELGTAWQAYSDNPNSGKAAADMGVAMVMARHDLFPKKCLQNRICPNCMFEQPKFFLSCPQCKGKFISAGTMNQCSPILILSTREEIDVMIRENEKALAEIEFLDDDSQESETKVNDDEEIKKEYSPRDDEMEVSDGQEEEVEIVDVDESDSLEVNHERLRRDLANYNGEGLLNTDPEDRITRFILFKIADFCVHQYGNWRRYVFDETDNSRAKLLADGIRHDITGTDHPVLRTGLGGPFTLERGLPVTVDEDTLRAFYEDRAKAPGATIDAEERVRRYRFSVMVTKLIEALYRRGYDLAGDFRTRVQACNSMSEQTTTEALRSRAQLREDVNVVEAAMKEALEIAYPDYMSFSFFSRLNPPGNLKISVHDFQSFYVSKNKKKITGEMVHVMHYYGIQNVPTFEDLASKHKRNNVDRPVVLKFLIDTPAGGSRGFNLLMPDRSNEVQRAEEQDVVMGETIAEEENKEEMEVGPAEPESSPDTAADDVSMEDQEKKEDKTAPPDPPLDPIIETPDQEEDTSMNMGEPSKGTVERVDEAQETEGLAAGLPKDQPGKPVVLKPRPPAPPPIMKAHAKPKPKEGAIPKDFTPGTQPEMPKMTTSVRQVPKKSESTTESKGSETVVEPKLMPKQPPHPPPSPRQKEMAAAAKEGATAAPPKAAAVDQVSNDGTTNRQDDRPWASYTGTGHDARDPRPPNTSNQQNIHPRARGRGRGGGTWQPIAKGESKGHAQTLSEMWDNDYGDDWSVNPTASSSTPSSRGRGRGRGGRGRGRAQHQYDDWIATGLRGSVGDVRHLLQWYYPDQYTYHLDEFWRGTDDDQWYVNGRSWR